MSDLRAKVSYLRGLSEGMDLSKSAEGRLLNGVIDVLNEFADSVADLEDAQEDMEEYLETLDEDLLALEDEVYGDNYWDEEGLVEVKCPRCGEIVCFNDVILDGEDAVEVSCPSCNEIVFVSGGERKEYMGPVEAEKSNVRGELEKRPLTAAAEGGREEVKQ